MLQDLRPTTEELFEASSSLPSIFLPFSVIAKLIHLRTVWQIEKLI